MFDSATSIAAEFIVECLCNALQTVGGSQPKINDDRLRLVSQRLVNELVTTTLHRHYEEVHHEGQGTTAAKKVGDRKQRRKHKGNKPMSTLGLRRKANQTPSTTTTSNNGKDRASTESSPRPIFAKVLSNRLTRRPLRHLRTPPSTANGMSNIRWPSARDFVDAHVGKNKIHEFIEKTWNDTSKSSSASSVASAVTYDVTHMYTAVLRTSRRYKYRVVWSFPDPAASNRRDARATACVYFNIDVPFSYAVQQQRMHMNMAWADEDSEGEDGTAPNSRSSRRPVEVSYTFQSDKNLHRPGRSRYHKQFMRDLHSATRT